MIHIFKDIIQAAETTMPLLLENDPRDKPEGHFPENYFYYLKVYLDWPGKLLYTFEESTEYLYGPKSNCGKYHTVREMASAVKNQISHVESREGRKIKPYLFTPEEQLKFGSVRLDDFLNLDPSDYKKAAEYAANNIQLRHFRIPKHVTRGLNYKEVKEFETVCNY